MYILEICDNSGLELIGRPCKDRVKAKKKTVSTPASLSSEEMRSWGFCGLPFPQEKHRITTVELPFEEYTGNSTACSLGETGW